MYWLGSPPWGTRRLKGARAPRHDTGWARVPPARTPSSLKYHTRTASPHIGSLQVRYRFVTQVRYSVQACAVPDLPRARSPIQFFQFVGMSDVCLQFGCVCPCLFSAPSAHSGLIHSNFHSAIHSYSLLSPCNFTPHSPHSAVNEV